MPTNDPRCAIAAARMFNAGFTAAAQELHLRWPEYSPYKQGRLLNDYFAPQG